MAQMQEMSGGFNGPPTPGLREKVRNLPRGLFRDRAVRLPRSVHAELARIASATRQAEDGHLKAASKVSRTLLHRATMGPTTADYERIDAIGYDAYLDEQLDYEALDNSELEDSLAETLPTLTMSPSELFDRYFNNPIIPVIELWTATVYRAAYSPRQLYERMVVFSSDHFNIDIFAQPQPLLKPVDDREVIRQNALGNFGELLSASAHSPSMLVYLTNDTNRAGAPNENYARELMELHTMGADNGYTETDVKEVARCLTGWTWSYGVRSPGEPGTFRFDARNHDKGKKKVLGKTIAAGGGIADGEQVIDLLIDRKETRAFIAEKMLRYLWGYEPKKTAINKVKTTYKQTGGDIRDMVRTALARTRMQSATTKLKRPFHLAVSAIRAMGAEIGDARFVLQSLRSAGHIPFDWDPPNGYPDSAEYWSGFILPRWNFGATLFGGDRNGFSVDAGLDDPNGTPNSIVNRLDDALLGGTMTKATRTQIKGYLSSGNLNRQRVQDAIGLTISSPEFQEY